MPYYRQNQKTKRGLLKGIWDWFVDPDYGPIVDTRGIIPHVHKWEYFNTIRMDWRIEEGRPVGKRIAINLAILDVEKYPSKNETKLSQLRDWQRSGYEYVHISQTVYRCKHYGCNVTKPIDCYAAPVRSNGSGPIVVDLNSQSTYQKKFTETTIINTSNYNANGKKEIAIEPMKRYGVKPKIKKEPPVVPMES